MLRKLPINCLQKSHSSGETVLRSGYARGWNPLSNEVKDVK